MKEFPRSGTVIAYKDFVPRISEPGGMLRRPTFWPLDDAVAAANAWIARERVDVFNVETVLLPDAEAPGRTLQSCGGQIYNAWRVVRVWYRRRA